MYVCTCMHDNESCAHLPDYVIASLSDTYAVSHLSVSVWLSRPCTQALAGRGEIMVMIVSLIQIIAAAAAERDVNIRSLHMWACGS